MKSATTHASWIAEASDPAVPVSTSPSPILSSAFVFAALAFLTGLGIGFVLWGGDQPDTSPVSPSRERLPVSADDDPSLGPDEAPVTIIEFSDFACPYCRKFHQETFPVLMLAYPDQLRFVYRDYPILSVESSSAAAAAQCAHEQGAFWAYHEALFRAQLGLGHDAYLSYAQILELDTAQFAECVESGRYAAEVEADARDASRWGVTGTPTFFLNGLRLVGAQPLEQFVAVIDGELGR